MIALKIDTKFDGKLTCASKNDMKNLVNFHQSTWKSQNWDFDGIFLSKVENVWASNLQRSYVSWQWRMMQNLKRNWLVSSKWTWGIWQILTQTLTKISKLCALMGCFWPKYIMFELKKVWRSYVWWHWILMQNLKENWLLLSKLTWWI